MKTETTRAGEFLISEANGNRSREAITVTGGPYLPGQVLGQITVGGAYTAYDAAANPADGSETAAAVLWSAADGSIADVTGVAIVRDAEVSEALLTGEDAGGLADLAALGVIAR